MKPKTLKVIYSIFGILYIIFILQELFPVLFVLPLSPSTSLITINFPLTTGIVIALILIFTAKFFKKSSEHIYRRMGSIRILEVILIVLAFCIYFIPYVSFNGLTTNIGFIYSIYTGIFGLILLTFSLFQLMINRIKFGLLIGTMGAGLGIFNHIKFFLYVLQQYNTRFEIGFYFGTFIWVILFLLNFISALILDLS